MLNVLTPLEETRAYREIFAEGRAEGEAEGEARGEARGKAESLKHLLTRRFGPLPDWAVQRIAGASLERLDVWLDGLLDAEGLRSLLDNGPH